MTSSHTCSDPDTILMAAVGAICESMKLGVFDRKPTPFLDLARKTYAECDALRTLLETTPGLPEMTKGLLSATITEQLAFASTLTYKHLATQDPENDSFKKMIIDPLGQALYSNTADTTVQATE